MTQQNLFAFVILTLGLANPLHAQWIATLPKAARSSILWSADHETGTLDEWESHGSLFPGGGIFNTGGTAVSAKATRTGAHSGRFSAMASITGANRAKNGSRAVRLMRWTDMPYELGGKPFPKKAYYSVWMYFPRLFNPNKYRPWDPGDGGWWNVFQFKAYDENEVCHPMWSLNVTKDDHAKQMYFYLYSPVNSPSSVVEVTERSIPVGKWFHVEAFYQVSSEDSGRVLIWQDGVLILRAERVRTALTVLDQSAVWGVGNYTDHISGDTVEGKAALLFDDAIVSKTQISRFLNNVSR